MSNPTTTGSYIFAPEPQPVFKVQPEFFRILKDTQKDPDDPVSVLSISHGQICEYTSTFEITKELKDITQDAIAKASEFLERSNHLGLTVTTGFVEPGKCLTGASEWHYDFFRNRTALLLSDALPTEFAAGSITDEEFEAAGYGHSDRPDSLYEPDIEVAISAGHLAARATEPNIAYALTTRSPHRAMVNPFDHIVERTFVVID